MEVNVTMTEEEYENFKLFREITTKEYLERLIKKNYSLLDYLHLRGIVPDDTGEAEFSPINNGTTLTIHCSSPRDFRGYIKVDIQEYFREYHGENGSRWIKPVEMKILGMNVED